MKIYQIDADCNALLRVKVDGDEIEILNAMNGWGINIKDNVMVEEIPVKEIKEEMK